MLKFNNKKILLIFLFILFIITLTSCNGNNIFNPGSKDSDGKITVFLDNKDKVFFESLIRSFETKYEEEGYKVEPIWTAGDDIQSSQATRIGAGRPADIIIGGDMYTELYRRNLLDLSELIERDNEEVDIDDFIDGVMDGLTNSSGNYVFMPRFFNLSLLYYNKGLFDVAKAALLASNITPAPEGTAEDSLHYPHINWTIDDYFTAAGILTKKEGSQYVQWGSSHVGGWWGEWLIHLRQSGGELFDENGFVTFNNESAKNAMQIFRDKAYGNVELGRPKITAAPGESDLAGFQSGKVAMEYGGHTASWSRFDSLSSLNWDVTLLPTGLETRSGAEFAVEGMGIYKDSKNIEAAWAFIKFVTSKEEIKNATDLGYLTVRKSVLNQLTNDLVRERTNLVVEAIDPNGPYANYARMLPKYEYFSEIAIDLIEPIISLMMANDNSRISIAEAVSRIERQANDYISLNYK